MKSPFHSHSGETALLKVESNPRVGRSSHQSYGHLLPGPTQRSMQLVPASSLRPFLPLATETSHSLLGIFPSQVLLLSAFCYAPPHLPNVDRENTHGDQRHSPTGNHLGLSPGQNPHLSPVFEAGTILPPASATSPSMKYLYGALETSQPLQMSFLTTSSKIPGNRVVPIGR